MSVILQPIDSRMVSDDNASIEVDPVLNSVHFRGVDVSLHPHRTDYASGRHASVASTAMPQRMSQKTPETLDSFVAQLLERAGLSADVYRVSPLHRRMPALLRRLRVDSLEAAQALLDARPELLPVALSTLLIGVSSFFRDTPVFEYLRELALPELLQTRRGVSVFGAGVSNGSELYSTAILLAEAGALDNSSLLGIDCRSDAITRARLGHFSDDEVALIEPPWRERYFQTEGAGWRADASMRSAIQWHCADLVTFPPPASDLILFRNVAIYFEQHPAAMVWEKLCSALTPGGFLVVGKAEKPPRGLSLQGVCKSVYQKKDAGL